MADYDTAHARFAMFVLPAALTLLAGCQKRLPAVRAAQPTHASSFQTERPREIATFARTPMVLVPAGEFVMGGGSDPDCMPVHKVVVSAFYMDCYEVTQELYEQLMKNNPARRLAHKIPSNECAGPTR